MAERRGPKMTRIDATALPSQTIGILSLDTRFPRPIGDAGNPRSYAVPARVKIVEGADSPLIVRDGLPDEDVLLRFENAARELEAQGVDAIVSTCGFLVTAQARMAGTVRVPVLLSALSLAPLVKITCPGRIGILTASEKALGPQALAAAGLEPAEIAIRGLDDVPEFRDTILVTRDAQPASFDQGAVERAVSDRAAALAADNPDLSAIILECGNLPPYAAAVRAATCLPVFHIVDAANALVRSAARASG
jgi:Asp/Glu/hydantoin racemase